VLLTKYESGEMDNEIHETCSIENAQATQTKETVGELYM
jgi:hypothetical protein